MANHFPPRRRTVRPLFEILEDRLAPAGGLPDLLFGGDGRVALGNHGRVYGNDVVALPNGKVIAVGTSSDGILVAKFNRDGSLDGNFGQGGTVVTDLGAEREDSASAIALDSSGRVLVVGMTTQDTGPFGFPDVAFFVARYSDRGELDTAFGQDGLATMSFPLVSFWATAVAVAPDDSIYVAGSFPEGFGVVRFDSSGVFDTDFGTDGAAYQNFGGGTAVGGAYDIALLPDGKILLAGLPRDAPGVSFALAQFTAAGLPDASFQSNGYLEVQTQSTSHTFNDVSMTLQPDGKVLLGGTIIPSGSSNEQFFLNRYNADGSQDASFNNGSWVTTGLALHELQAAAVLLQQDFKIVVVGSAYLTVNQQNPDLTLARYLPDGTLDPDYGVAGIARQELGGRQVAFGATIRLDDSVVIVGDAEYETDKNFGLASFSSGESRTLALTPEQTIYRLGESARVTALVFENGQPVANVRVDFFARQGAAIVYSAALQTDANGAATFVYTGTTAGIDDLSAVIHGTEKFAAKTITWTAPNGYFVVMSLVGASPRDGNDLLFVDTVRAKGTHAVKARLLLNGQPVNNQEVSFTVKSHYRDESGDFTIPEENPNPVRTFTTGLVDFNNNGTIEPDEIGGCILDGITRGREAQDEVVAFFDLNGNHQFDVGEDRNRNGQIDPAEDMNNNGLLDAGEDRNFNFQLDPSEDSNNNGLLDLPEGVGSYVFQWIGGRPVVVPHWPGGNGVFGSPIADNTIRAPLDRDLTVNLRLLRDIGFRGTAPDIYAGNPADDGELINYEVISGPNAGWQDSANPGNTQRTRLGDLSFTLPAPNDGNDDVIRITTTIQTHLKPNPDLGGEAAFVWHEVTIVQLVRVDWLAPIYDLDDGDTLYDDASKPDDHLRKQRMLGYTVGASIPGYGFSVFIGAPGGEGFHGVPFVIRHVSGPNQLNLIVLPGDQDELGGITEDKDGEIFGYVQPSNIASTPGTDRYELIVDGVVRDEMLIDWLPAESLGKSAGRTEVTVSNAPFGPESVTFSFPEVTREGTVVVTEEQVYSQPPANFRVSGLPVFNFNTMGAEYKAPIDISIRLGGRAWTLADLPEIYHLKFLHWENGQWVDRTIGLPTVIGTALDPITDVIIRCRVDSLSPFAIFEFVQPPPPLVESVVINDGSVLRDTISKITVTFTQDVTIEPGAFALSPQKGKPVALTVGTSVVNGKTVAVLQIVGKPIKTSKLRLLIRGAKIQDAFAQLFDGNRDGTGGDDYGLDFTGAAFLDDDGDTYTLSLKGAGQALVTQDDANADGRGPIQRLTLQNTDPAKSTLTITVTKGKQGNGRVTVRDIVGTGLKSLTAGTTDLVGGVINLSGYLGALTIGDIQEGADITLAAGTAKQTTAITAHVIGAGSTIDIRSPISTFTAAAMGDGKIMAPSIATLSIKGDAKAKPAIRGDFLADLTLNGPPLPGKPVLGAATISGNIADALWSMAGDIGKLAVNGLTTNWNLDADSITQSAALGEVAQTRITVDGQVKSLSATTFINSLLFAGFQPTNAAAPMLGGTFLPAGSVNSFNVNGKKNAPTPSFVGSTVAAVKIGTVSLASIANANAGMWFGILADISIGGVSVKTPKFAFDKTKPTPQGAGDFQVTIAAD